MPEVQIDLLQVERDIHADLARPSRDRIMMELAHSVARRSTCRRRRVGVVITNLTLTEVFAYGYNGSGRGMVNDCDSAEAGNCGCIHAEVNALVRCTHREASVLFSTVAPCRACAKLVLNSHVSTVVYDQPYRTEDGLNVLRTGGVAVLRFKMGALPGNEPVE